MTTIRHTLPAEDIRRVVAAFVAALLLYGALGAAVTGVTAGRAASLERLGTAGLMADDDG